MTLRFYLAGSAASDHGDNWRTQLVGNACFTRGRMLDGNMLAPDALITEGVLPGGFDYVGAYIEEKGHNAYGMEWEFSILHKVSIAFADVLFAWMPYAGAGTHAEIGYATAQRMPVIFAYLGTEEDGEREFLDTTFIEQFGCIHKAVYAATPREAWGKFAAAPMRYMRYLDYLNTPHWQRVRNAVYERRPKVCEKCGSPSNVQLHHLTYERVGREAFEDLQPLCGTCHQLEHMPEVSR